VLGLGIRFTKLLRSVVQLTAHLSWISVMAQAMDEKFSKMKVQWWTYKL